MAAPSEVGAAPLRRTVARVLVLTRRRSCGLPDRLGERDEVVAARRRRLKLAFVPDQVPAARRGKSTGVALAQVVRVGFGEGGEGADHRGGVRVDVGQRGYGRLRATVAGTTPG